MNSRAQVATAPRTTKAATLSGIQEGFFVQLQFFVRNAALLLACLIPAQAFAHGVMRVPASRAIGSVDEDYQFCFGTPGCECGDYPEAGELTATYEAGQTIDISIEITQSHDSNAVFRFQLCPPDELSVECFTNGEFTTEAFDRITGVHDYSIQLPAELVCDPCVLRWKWDYGFLSCADVRIVPVEVGVDSEASWAALKSRFR
jgi:hypothetical protein